MSEYIIFARRKPIGGKYPIVDGLEFKPIEDHDEFFMFKITQDQYNKIHTIGYDCVSIDKLRIDNPDSDFLNATKSDEVKDITSLGDLALVYLDYIEPPIEEA